jgi:hypothetical protein
MADLIGKDIREFAIPDHLQQNHPDHQGHYKWGTEILKSQTYQSLLASGFFFYMVWNKWTVPDRKHCYEYIRVIETLFQEVEW